MLDTIEDTCFALRKLHPGRRRRPRRSWRRRKPSPRRGALCVEDVPGASLLCVSAADGSGVQRSSSLTPRTPVLLVRCGGDHVARSSVVVFAAGGAVVAFSVAPGTPAATADFLQRCLRVRTAVIGNFVDIFGLCTILPLIPFFVKDVGAPKIWVGLISGAQFLGCCLGNFTRVQGRARRVGRGLHHHTVT